MKKYLVIAIILSLSLCTVSYSAQKPRPSPPPMTVTEIDGDPVGVIYKIKFSNGAVTINGDGTATVVTGVGGGGDVSGGAASSAGELVVYDGASGKIIKQSGLGAGIPLLSAAAVVSIAAAGTDYLAPAAINDTVQAHDADLDYLATFTPTANVKSILNAADYAAVRALMGLGTSTATQLNYLNAAIGTTGTASQKIVFDTSPTLVTPVLGVAAATSINKIALTAPATGATLTLVEGKTLTVTKTIELTSPDDTSVATFPAGAGTVAYTGTLTNTKWCTSDGVIISCTQDSPTGSGTITKVGDITSGEAFSTGTPGKTLIINNATSGTITLQAIAGALGTRVISLPAETGTICTTGSICTGYTPIASPTFTGTATIPTLNTTNPVGVIYGGTGLATFTTAYGLLAAGTTATGTPQTLAAGLTTQILVGGGASALPAWGTDIPTAVTIGTAYIYRAAGTDIPVTDGGTGRSTSTTAYGLLAAGTTATGTHQTLAAGLTTQVLVGGGTGAVPAWGTDLPTAVTIGTAYVYRVGGTDVSVADGGTGRSTLTLNGVLYGTGTSAVGMTAIGAAGQLLRVGADPFVPAWSTLTMPNTIAAGSVLVAQSANTLAALTSTSGTLFLQNADGVMSWAAGVGTIGGSTGGTDNVILTANGTGGVTLQANPGGATVSDAGLLTVTSISAGTGTFTVSAAGAVVGASFTASKATGVAGAVGMYEANSTDTTSVYWMGPASISTGWAYQLSSTEPAAGQVMVFGAPAGVGGPGGVPVSAQTWVTPLYSGGALGTPSSATLTNATGLPVATGISGFGTGVATALAANVNGSGGAVLYSGALGTPTSGTLTNTTGLPIATGVSGLGSGVADFLATPSSANFATALTGENASGAFITNPMTTAGDLIVGVASGVSTGRIEAVALGQVLTSKGTGTAPAWDAAPQITSINLGHADDTTLARTSAGIINVEGANVITGTLGATTNVIPKANGTGTVTLQASGITEDGTNVSLGALNLVTSGTISGAIKMNSDVDGMSQGEMTAVGMYGSMFWATGAGTWNLPAAAAGMSFCLYSTTLAAVIINPDDADVLVYDGVADTAGHQIAGGAAAGDFICFVAIDTTNWHSMGRRGTWTPGS